MIFGKSEEEKVIARNKKIARDLMGQKSFAFWPVKLTDGRWVWLHIYYKIRNASAYYLVDEYGCFVNAFKGYKLVLKEGYEQNPFRKEYLSPMRSHAEDCVSLASMGLETRTKAQWLEKKAWWESIGGEHKEVNVL